MLEVYIKLFRYALKFRWYVFEDFRRTAPFSSREQRSALSTQRLVARA